jgi:choline dehydrogenase-like flavoprotein
MNLPLIGYFTDKDDMDIATMREGIKLSRKLAHSESFAKYRGDEIFPGEHVQTDDQLDAYIRDVSPSLFNCFFVIVFFFISYQYFIYESIIEK